MKKIMYTIITFIMMISVSGCSLFNTQLNQLSDELSMEEKAMEHIETTVIQALENEDEKLLKSIFSEKALTKAGDINKGITHIFDIYEGEFVRIFEDGHSSGAYSENGETRSNIRGWCIIETDEERYILSSIEWMEDSKKPESIGIYNLQMDIYREEELHPYSRIAGINYPNRDKVHKIILDFKEAFDSFEKSNIELFTYSLSSNLLAKEDTEEQIEALAQVLSSFSYSDVGDGWVTYGEIDGKEKMHAYYEIIIDNKPHIIHFTFDDVETDKLSVFQIVEDNGKGFEEETECGIYLP